MTLKDGTAGTLFINTYVTPVSSTVDTIRFQLVTVTCILLAAAALLTVLIARHISRPLIETNKAARELSVSRYTVPRHGRGYREIAELNETLVKAAEDLSRVDELQHELIANISHDLRTPLTMIGGYAEVMRDIPSETTPENLQIIIDETTRLTTLVNELLEFSRLQTTDTELERQPFDLTATMLATTERIAGMTAKNGYSIRFEPERHVTVLADEKRVNQVVYNLIGNALTYTGEDKRVTVEQRELDGRVRISVSDTGKGIPEEERPYIWNRYYRTKESHKRAVVGSGLGLHIVQTILEKHGAAYGVGPGETCGTTFWFELPLAEKEDAASH